MSQTFELSVLGDIFVVCRFEPAAPLPAWTLEHRGFLSITRTDDELSLICAEDCVPDGTATAPRWRGLKVHGPFSLDTIGVLAALSQALAAAGVSLLAVSTHDTDYLLVHVGDLARAVRALRHAGHVVHTSS